MGDVRVLSDRDCEGLEGTRCLTSRMVCADGKKKDSCQNDSGGPLAVQSWFWNRYPPYLHQRYTLIGVVSFGDKCGVSHGVYARVTSVLNDWIHPLLAQDQDVIFCSTS